MKGPTITEGIDIANKIGEGDDFDFRPLIKEAETVSNAHQEEAIAPQKEKVKGIMGNASIVLIQNQTATRLKLVFTSDDLGHVHKTSAIPECIEPGSNAAFAHIAKETHLKSGSGAHLLYEIYLYIPGKGWKSAGSNIGFLFRTGPYGKISFDKFKTNHTREIMATETIYDGQRVVGSATLDDKTANIAVHTFKMIQEKGEGEFAAAKNARGAADKIDHVQEKVGAKKIASKVDKAAGKIQGKVKSAFSHGEKDKEPAQ